MSSVLVRPFSTTKLETVLYTNVGEKCKLLCWNVGLQLYMLVKTTMPWIRNKSMVSLLVTRFTRAIFFCNLDHFRCKSNNSLFDALNVATRSNWLDKLAWIFSQNINACTDPNNILGILILFIRIYILWNDVYAPFRARRQRSRASSVSYLPRIECHVFGDVLLSTHVQNVRCFRTPG